MYIFLLKIWTNKKLCAGFKNIQYRLFSNSHFNISRSCYDSELVLIFQSIPRLETTHKYNIRFSRFTKYKSIDFNLICIFIKIHVFELLYKWFYQHDEFLNLTFHLPNHRWLNTKKLRMSIRPRYGVCTRCVTWRERSCWTCSRNIRRQQYFVTPRSR